MCKTPSEGTLQDHRRCEQRVHRETPNSSLDGSDVEPQYGREKRPHSSKIMRLVVGRKPEETSDAVCGAGPTGYSGAGSTEKGSTPINQENDSGIEYEGKDQRDKG